MANHEHDWFLTEGRSAIDGGVKVWLQCPCGKTISTAEYDRLRKNKGLTNRR